MKHVKQTLRQSIADQRMAMPLRIWQQKSEAIAQTLCAGAEYQNANRIFTFLGSCDKREVNTQPIVQAAWADDKEVFVPISLSGGSMYFVPYTETTALHPSHYGILEPTASPLEAVHPDPTDLFLVPGLVFDQNGNRYGYGGGYYDRYLAQYPVNNPIGLGFDFQVVGEPLQIEPHDIPMAQIITG